MVPGEWDCAGEDARVIREEFTGHPRLRCTGATLHRSLAVCGLVVPSFRLSHRDHRRVHDWHGHQSRLSDASSHPARCSASTGDFSRCSVCPRQVDPVQAIQRQRVHHGNSRDIRGSVRVKKDRLPIVGENLVVRACGASFRAVASALSVSEQEKGVRYT